MHDHMYYPSSGRSLALYPNTRQASRACTSPAASLPFAQLAASRRIRTLNSSQPSTREKWPVPGFTSPDHIWKAKARSLRKMRQLTDAEDARRTVEYWIAEGATSFKAYMNITPDELAAAVKAAHAHGLKVTGHLCSIGFREAAALGIDDLEHGLFVDTEFFPGKKPGQCPDDPSAAEKSLLDLDIAAVPVQDMIRDLVGHHVAITSTLPVFETLVPNRAPLDARVLDAMLPDARIEYLERRSSISDHAATSFWPALFKKELEFEREFVKRGGLLLAGLDPTGYGGVIAGFGDQREVELLVEAASRRSRPFTSPLRTAPNSSASSIKLARWLRAKPPTSWCCKGDPSVNIKDIEKVEMVFKDGVGYDSAKLIESVRGQVGLH